MQDISLADMPQHAEGKRVPVRSEIANPDHLDTGDELARRQSFVRLLEHPVERDHAHGMALRHLRGGELPDYRLHAANRRMELADDVNNPHLNAMPPLRSQIQSGQRASQRFVSHLRKDLLSKFFARF